MPRRYSTIFNRRSIIKLCLTVGFLIFTLLIFDKWRLALNFVSFLKNSGEDHLPDLYGEGAHIYGAMRKILLGKQRDQKGYLTIGISSVHRDKGDYLFATLQSLIDKSTTRERQDVVTIVCLSDADSMVRSLMAKNISEFFRPELESGFLLVIQTPPDIYPTLKNLRRTYDDPPERVSWRAKQAIDFSYLFNFSFGISQYYMILEDDVVCLQGYLTEIRNQIESTRPKPWLTLHFSGFLIIGTVFQSHHLPKIAQFINLFYAAQPVDFLILRYFEMLVPGTEKSNLLQRVPSIFQHVGYYSTLGNKLQPLVDEAFPGDVPELYTTNPPARVFTTIRTFDRYLPHLAYSANLSFFWGIPRKGDTYDIVFQNPIKVTQVVVVTGLPATQDYLQHGVLMTSPRLIKIHAPNQVSCFHFETVARFTRGKVNATSLSSDVQCIRIMVTKPQKNWLIIRRVAVFV